MLDSFKRLFGKQGNGRDLSAVADWAERRAYSFKRVRGDEGFVVDGVLDGKPWRLEWGPPQRDYIYGHELRLRMELALPSDMQMLLLSRPLMDVLERRTYELFTDSVQTQIGSATPEEMRWLVMFPKLSLSGMKSLRGRFGGVASTPATGLAWIEGPLAHQLEAQLGELLNGDPAFVLMTLRSRAYMRLQLVSPTPQAIAAAIALFETAVAQALQLAGHAGHSGDTSGWNQSSGGSTAWQSIHGGDSVPPPSKRR
ncbi:MAG TPA: hypothetical protein VJO99_09330 [Burkholderiaceae bacterium]|nr:hypothetical protein [Burkholderiaceae bacterium]